MYVQCFYVVENVASKWLPLNVNQVKAIRAEHGKKSFGPVLVDQLYGYVQFICVGAIMTFDYIKWNAWPAGTHLGWISTGCWLVVIGR